VLSPLLVLSNDENVVREDGAEKKRGGRRTKSKRNHQGRMQSGGVDAILN